jgi:hypothetical protein
MKRAVIDAHFVELKGQCDFIARGEGGSAKVAIGRGFASLFKERKLRGKRITSLRATIVLIEVVKCSLCGYELCRCAVPEEEAGEG